MYYVLVEYLCYSSTEVHYQSVPAAGLHSTRNFLVRTVYYSYSTLRVEYRYVCTAVLPLVLHTTSSSTSISTTAKQR